MREKLHIAVDVMGSDFGPRPLLAALDGLVRRYPQDVAFQIFGRAEEVEPLLKKLPRLTAASHFRPCESVIAMEQKPSLALRRGRKSSMWKAVSAVKKGKAQAAISAGNTGALMAMSRLALRMLPGIERPAIAALWPTVRGRAVVLDVGATINCSSAQFVQFAVMGTAYARAILGALRPKIGLLNIGVEEVKGTDNVRGAAEILERSKLNFVGFVEGDDIPSGAVDIIVTDGFTGNIALKTAEGTAKQIGQFLREALRGSLAGRMGGFLAAGALKRLRARINPSNVNGGVFLGLNGIVVKSHGGASRDGFAAAVEVAIHVARAGIAESIEREVEDMAPLLGSLNAKAG